MTDSALALGRELYRRKEWTAAYAQLGAADRAEPLEYDDLEQLAIAAFLLGHDDESSALRERSYQECVGRDDGKRAARCAFWLGFSLANRGDFAHASGWFGRAHDALEPPGNECAEHGLLLLPAALLAMFSGDSQAAAPVFAQAVEIGDRFHDPDVATLGRLGHGQSLIDLGSVGEGITLLDQAMLAVTDGGVSPVLAGVVYCAVIEACQDTFDIRRAREWTGALTAWCDAQPDLVPYHGQCLVHRAEIMRLRGEWVAAMDEAERACRLLSERPHAALGAAWYEKGELYRLRGELAAAEDAYRQASQCGREPQPGLAQLRLRQGRRDASEAAIRRVVDESQERRLRSKVLIAYVEIVLAVDDVAAAHAAATELAGIAVELAAPFLDAEVAYAQGAIALAEGDARRAVTLLRLAATTWNELDAPFEAARARVLVGAACRDVGDVDTAEMEWDAARGVLRELGASPELDHLDEISRPPTKTASGLTGREIEVLGFLAAGKTNREIADALVISEKTVARHVSNIFAKIDVSTRAAATAYAFTHDLV